MQIAGALPEDAPDPRLEVKARLRNLRFPLMSLAPGTATALAAGEARLDIHSALADRDSLRSG